MTSEFELIRRYFRRPLSHTLLGGGDDAALIRPASGNDLVVSVDMLVENVHFLAGADPEKLGHKALAVNLSDLAAMGAEARWATLAISLPEADEQWLDGFSRGFFRLALEYAVDLIGGDTTRGPLCIAVQVLGEVPCDAALRRDGARPGNDIWISGVLGEAALGLAHLQNKIQLERDSAAICLRRLHTPQPRIGLGRALRGIASAAIDISDGLLADLGHIAAASGVGAELMVDQVLPERLPGVDRAIALNAALAGGDDYELCFCALPQQRDAIGVIAQKLQLPLTRVGRIVAGCGVSAIGSDGRILDVRRRGFDHFQPSP